MLDVGIHSNTHTIIANFTYQGYKVWFRYLSIGIHSSKDQETNDISNAMLTYAEHLGQFFVTLPVTHARKFQTPCKHKCGSIFHTRSRAHVQSA